MGLGGSTHAKVKMFPSFCFTDRQREGAVICIWMCSHTDRRGFQECGVKRYPKSHFKFRREAFWVCIGKFNLLSELETTVDKRAKGAAVWSLTVSSRRRDDSKSLPVHWVRSIPLAELSQEVPELMECSCIVPELLQNADHQLTVTREICLHRPGTLWKYSSHFSGRIT